MEFLQRVIDQRKDESYEEAVESMNSDDSFEISGMHKKIDSVISSWGSLKYRPSVL